MRALIIPAIISSLFLFSSCNKDQNDKDSSVNLFSVDQDMEFGAQMHQEILANPAEYPLMDENQFPEAYAHLKAIRDEILKSDNLNYKDRFGWDVYIIRNDSVLNAFCTPGGYMYFYTGLIKFLDNEAQFAGVMAHEMAHADRRHVTDQLTKMYGVQILLSVVLGTNASAVSQTLGALAGNLGGLYFSRDNEYEADAYAIKYAADTKYYPKGIAGFFEKLEAAHQTGRTVEFLSTHPSPDNRLEEMDRVWKELGSPAGSMEETAYASFKSKLP